MRKTPGVGFYGKIRIPTIGHKTAIDVAKQIASRKNAKLHIAVSGASYPLTVSQKEAIAKKLFQHPIETNHKNIIDFLSHMSQYHDDFTLVCGSDRAYEYRSLISRYNGNKDRNGKIPFSFRKWEVHEVSGKRTNSNKSPLRMSPDELVRSVSATKIEQLVREGKYEEFHAYYPGMSKTETKRFYNQIRRGLSLHEQRERGQHWENGAENNCNESNNYSSSEIGGMVAEAKIEEAKGNQPALSLSISRDLLPQIPKDKMGGFLKYLKKQNISSETKDVQTKNLKSSQGEFDINKIFSIAMSDKEEPIIISNDDHVLDGHHRWVAKHGKKIQAHVIDLPILELIRIAKEYAADLKEETKKWEMDGLIDKFSTFACSKLGISSKKPTIIRQTDNDKSFGGYHPGEKTIYIVTKNRHPVDVFRTLAHELVHYKQDLDGRIKDVAKEGATGSPIEDEANYMAGRILRWWAKENPNHFSLGSLTENVAIFVVGGPCSGKDQYIKQLKEETGYYEQDINSLLKNRRIRGDIIINASANNLENIVEAKELLNSNGYHTSLLFVDTSDEISRLRNEQRKEKGQRVIAENVRFSKYSEAQKNKQEFIKLFGEDMKEINNNKKFGIDLKPQIKIGKKKRKPTEISDPNPSIEATGVGATFGGFSKVQKPFGLAESIKNWMENPKTQQRFSKKYGNLAEKKLHETAMKLNENLKNEKVIQTPKTISKIRESIDKGLLDTTGTVPGPPVSINDPLPEKGKIFKRKAKIKNK